MTETRNGELQQPDYDFAEDARIINSLPGSLTGVDCKICKNRGYVMLDTGSLLKCACMEQRAVLRRIKDSGLMGLLDKCTFNSFEAKTDYQRRMKAAAEAFVGDTSDAWFYCGGQVGCGKTHICTAICGEYIDAGLDVVFMPWQDDSIRLKACVTDEEYGRAIARIKDAAVLYIDDFLKTRNGAAPTDADIRLALEIINRRYIDRGLKTIISSERMIGDYMDIDEALGSRLYERAKNYCIEIAPDKRKNYRLGGQT